MWAVKRHCLRGKARLLILSCVGGSFIDCLLNQKDKNTVGNEDRHCYCLHLDSVVQDLCFVLRVLIFPLSNFLCAVWRDAYEITFARFSDVHFEVNVYLRSALGIWVTGDTECVRLL